MTSTKSGTDFTVRLAHARQLSSRFAAATDALNVALADAEKALTELGLGVSASVLIASEDFEDGDTPYTYASYLTFCKTGKTWRLQVESGPDDDPAHFSSSPVCDTSRETRLLAAKHLPELLDSLIGRAEAELQEVEANANAVKSLVQTIRSGGSGLDLLGAEVV